MLTRKPDAGQNLSRLMLLTVFVPIIWIDILNASIFTVVVSLVNVASPLLLRFVKLKIRIENVP